MALKKMDYLVVDDRITRSQSGSSAQSNSTSDSKIGMFTDVLGEDPWLEQNTPLTKGEIQGELLVRDVSCPSMGCILSLCGMCLVPV